ncbi:MAG: methyl-accepting chemotaxis protein [Cellulosilyticum sp.]|nr:methyl-accepting chemotaxis protein [Cellulosilyticum sp.]
MQELQSKKKSIKGYFLMILTPVITVSLILIIGINYLISHNIIVKLNEQSLMETSKASINEINSWYNNIITELNSIKRTLDQLPLTIEQEEAYVKTTYEINDYMPAGVYIGDQNNGYIDAGDWIPDKDYIVTEREWYIEGLKHNELNFGSPYIDKSTGEYVISASVKLNDANKDKVMAADISLRDTSNMIADMNLGVGGKAFIVETTNYAILAHYDEQLVATTLKDESQSQLYKNIYSEIASGRLGLFTIRDENAKYIVNVEKVTNENWLMVSYIPEKEILIPLKQLQYKSIALAIVVMIVVLILLERMIHLMVNSIRNLTKVVVKITEGDFTVQVNDLQNNEIGIMSNGIKQFISKMRQIINSNMDITKELSYQSESNIEIAEVLYKSANEQSCAMTELNTAVEELSKSVYEIADNATVLAHLVTNTKEAGEESRQTIEEVVNVSDQGKQSMEQVNRSMEDITKAIQHLVEVVTKVEVEMVNINGIINIIGQIADETNLLALNASIEAARSGEAGKGFAVVANQIGKLAESSTDAVEDIARIINEVNYLVKDTKTKTEESVEAIKESEQVVRITNTRFDKIYEMINTVRQVVEGIIIEVNQVDEVASNLVAISQEQAASGEEIAEASEKLLDSAEQVKGYSKQVEEEARVLEETAHKISDNMSYFKIN